MLRLKDEIDPHEFQQITRDGYFTIRRKDIFWSGIWSDMTIEQVLMRAIKSSGGPTHGRGMIENVISRWVSNMPAACHVRECVEKLLSKDRHEIHAGQHVEL